MSTTLRIIAAALLGLCAAGCAGRLEPTGPAAGKTSNELAAAPLRDTTDTSGAGLYPLESGNRWSYAREFTLQFHPNAGPPSDFEFSSTIESEQTCNEPIGGRPYLIERQVESGGGETFFTWIRFRQDGAGLYEYDKVDRPACEDLSARAGTRTADTATTTTVATVTHRRVDRFHEHISSYFPSSCSTGRPRSIQPR